MLTFRKKRRMLFCLWIIVLILSLFGCSGSRNSQRGISDSAYKQFMERQRALASEEEASKGNPVMTSAELESVGDFYARQGNLAMAFLKYEQALRLDRDQPNLHYKLGLLFLSKGMAEEARHEFLEVLKANPRHAQAFEGMGWVFFKSGDLERAEANLKEAIRLEDSLWQAHHLLGIIYDRRRNSEVAIEQYRKAISIKPDIAMLHNNLGMSLLLRGDYSEALEAFSQGLKLEASNHTICNNLALTLCKLGKYEEALEVFKRGGDEAAAYNNLGYFLMMEGKNKEAIEAFEKALEIKPGFYTKAFENLRRAKTAYSSSP